MSSSSARPINRRRTSVLAVTAAATVVAGLSAGLAGAPAGTAAPARASAAAPNTPVANGTAWLTRQLTGGLIHNTQYDFDDYGLSVDSGLALAAVGDTAEVTTISNALAPNVTAYYSYNTGVGSDTHISAGSVAKALVLAQTAGADPTTYGGQNLVSTLEARVSTTTGSAGRIGDQYYPADPYETDFANVIGQAFAARGLATAGSADAVPVTSYLLAQQCPAGYFPLTLSDTTADSCSVATTPDTPSVDATALTMIELEGTTDPAAQAALAKAATWLESVQDTLVPVQGPAGYFTTDGSAGAGNANSTGLAGWALGDYGDSLADARAKTAAEHAGAWVRGHQADDPTACRTELTGERGAIAYDDTALATGRKDGIDTTAQDQFRRAAAQALPALRYAPVSSRFSATPTGEYLRAGVRTTVRLSGVAPGATVCFTGHADGRTRLVTTDDTGGPLDTTTKTATRTGAIYEVIVAGTQTRTWTLLAPTSLKVAVSPGRVTRGHQTRVTVARGLVAHEPVTVTYKGRTVYTGRAGVKGRFTHRVAVGRAVGAGRLVVRGAFADRSGRTRLGVTR